MNRNIFKSRRYHEFFEGYTEQTCVVNGKERIERLYTGDYYCSDLDRKNKIIRKVTYSILFFVILLNYIYIATRMTSFNIARTTGICHGIISVLLLWLLVSVVYYVSAKDEMTVRIYRSGSKRLIKLSIITSIAFIALSVNYLVLFIIGRDISEFLDLFPYSVIGFGLAFFIYKTENGTKYNVIKNNISVDGGEEIEY